MRTSLFRSDSGVGVDRRWPAFGVVGLIAITIATPLHGQEISGRLLDLDSGAPVSHGQVGLLNSRFEVLVSIQSDSAGNFRLAAPFHGGFYLYGMALGYRRTVAGPYTVTDSTANYFEFGLSPDPLDVEAIKVSATRPSSRLAAAGFYQRKTVGVGLFIDEDEIADASPVLASDLFRSRRGVRVRTASEQGGLVKRQVLFRRGCMPRLYIDGVLVRDSGGGPVIDELVAPGDISGIEAFRSPSEVPLQYGGTGTGCGVLLIWTK